MKTAILNTHFPASVGSLNEISHKSWSMKHENGKEKNARNGCISSKHVNKE
jgi:hypothetical protein